MAVILKRVCYGKKDVPMEKREYRMLGDKTPVGCIAEIITYIMKPLNVKKALLDDIDGRYILNDDGTIEK